MGRSGTKRLRSAGAGLAMMFACQAALGAVVCRDPVSREKCRLSEYTTAALLEAAVDDQAWGDVVRPLGGMMLSATGSWSEQGSPTDEDRDAKRSKNRVLPAPPSGMSAPASLAPSSGFGPLNPAMSATHFLDEQPPLTAALPREGKSRLPSSPLFGLFRPPQRIS